MPFNQQNKIRIFNIASILVIGLALFYSILSSFLHYYIALGLVVFEFITLQLGLYLIYKKQYSTAFHSMFFTNFLFLFVSSILLGEKAQIHIYFLFMPLAANILFDKLKTIVLYFIISMVLLLSAMLLFRVFQPIYPNSFLIEMIGFLSLVFTGVLIFFSIRQFKTENNAFNEEINFQRLELKEKNKDITDSIHYAQRIQKALMASDHLLKSNLPEYFVLYKPKDIVSGDFYWAEKIDSRFLLSASDCTGHGVPGAFMSLLNITKLNETVHEKKIIRPDLILNQVREDIIKVLNPEGTTEQTRDGMDAVLCSFDLSNLKLEFAGANNPLWIIRKKSLEFSVKNEVSTEKNSQLTTQNFELREYKPDKMPVGMYSGEKRDFTLNTIDLQKGDCVYLFTDGYADQFGGPKGKKFKYAQLKEVLLSVCDLTMKEQQLALQQKIESWKDALEQVDDILIIGVRV
jgi:serine phosphatase RsbU (regulator of sigma subunit)